MVLLLLRRTWQSADEIRMVALPDESGYRPDSYGVEEVSTYYAADEVAGTHRGLMIAIPE